MSFLLYVNISKKYAMKNNEELQKIRKWLPRGYAKIIQEKTGKNIASIYQVGCGRTCNDEIYRALLDLAIENKKEIEERQKLISTL